MKSLYSIVMVLFFSNTCSYGQVNTIISPEANSFYNQAMPRLKPSVKTFVEKNAASLRGRSINTDSLRNRLKNEKILKNAGQQEIDAVALLIMIQASKNADADLKDLVTNKNNYDIPNSQKRAEWIIANKSRIAENVALVMRKLPPASEELFVNIQ